MLIKLKSKFIEIHTLDYVEEYFNLNEVSFFSYKKFKLDEQDRTFVIIVLKNGFDFEIYRQNLGSEQFDELINQLKNHFEEKKEF